MKFIPDQPQSSPACACLDAPHDHLVLEKELGMDDAYATITLFKCPDCGQFWLKLLIEDEAFTASGRWYLGAITARQAARLAARDARSILEGLSWYFFGGSYYDGRTGKTSGPIG